jgi:hypothetical protein
MHCAVTKNSFRSDPGSFNSKIKTNIKGIRKAGPSVPYVFYNVDKSSVDITCI